MLKRRKVSNYFANATLSKKYHFRLMAISFFFMAAVLFYLLQVIRDVTQKVSFVAINDELAAEHIYESMNHLMVMMTLSFVVYFLFSVLFVLFIEQKVGGPTVAILEYIEQLKAGNYDYNRNLRTGDELESIMQSLKELKTQLQEKSAQPPTR